jgi:hypothetical protein
MHSCKPCQLIAGEVVCFLGTVGGVFACVTPPTDPDLASAEKTSAVLATAPIGTKFAGADLTTPSAFSSIVSSPIGNPSGAALTSASTVWSIVYDPILGGLFARVNLPFAIPSDCFFSLNRVSDGAGITWLMVQNGSEIDSPSGVLISDSVSTTGLADVSWVPPDTYQLELISWSEGALSTSPQIPVVPPPAVTVQPYSGTNPCYGPALSDCTNQYDMATQSCNSQSVAAFWQCELAFGTCVQNECQSDENFCKSDCQSTSGDCQWTCNGTDPSCESQCMANASTCESNCGAKYNDCLNWSYPEDCSTTHNICRTNAAPDTCLAGAAGNFSSCKGAIPICI